jgi:hypothetical protein
MTSVMSDEQRSSISQEFIIIVSGSREWRRSDIIHKELTAVEVPDNYTPVLVHGDCKTGADQLAIKSSMTLGWKNRPYPVTNEQWKLMGRSAGPRRNAYMINTEKPHVILTFCKNKSPGTSGFNQLSTAYCSRLDSRCILFKKIEDDDGKDLKVRIVKSINNSL